MSKCSPMVRQENCTQDFERLEFDLSLQLAGIYWVRSHHWGLSTEPDNHRELERTSTAGGETMSFSTRCKSLGEASL